MKLLALPLFFHEICALYSSPIYIEFDDYCRIFGTLYFKSYGIRYEDPIKYIGSDYPTENPGPLEPYWYKVTSEILLIDGKFLCTSIFGRSTFIKHFAQKKDFYFFKYSHPF